MAYGMLAANIDNLAIAIGFFQNLNDLALRKSRLLHFALREAIFTRSSIFQWPCFTGRLHLEYEQIPMLDALSEALREYREESEGFFPEGSLKKNPHRHPQRKKGFQR